MAGVRLRVETDLSEVQAGLDKLVAKLRNLKPFWQEVGEELLTSTKDRFDRSEAPDGSKWAPNRPVTLARKAPKTKPLIQRSHLRDTLRAQPSATELLFGTKQEYGAVHQFGAAKGAFGKTKRGALIPWGDIPARPYLGLSAEDRVMIKDLIRDYLVED